MDAICESGIYRIDGLDSVHVNVRRGACSVRARWKAGRLHVSAPHGISARDLSGILSGMLPRLQQIKPDAPYYIGQSLHYPEIDIEIHSQSHVPDRIFLQISGRTARILVGTAWDMASPDTIRNISEAMCRCAKSVAMKALLPRAAEVADILGRAPLGWEISNGHRTLGHCNSRRVIALSYALVFYEPALRDFVICHELAHLSEMNHSTAFHILCDTYCRKITGETEQQLSARLRAVRTPVSR